MNKNKNTYRFHDPNGAKATADRILPLLFDTAMQSSVCVYAPTKETAILG